jgi:hypothetical protein
MTTDYSDAGARHWDDANHLLMDNRLASADHLLGLSAECSFKAVMLGLGMVIDQYGAPVDKCYRVHINKLWDEFITFSDNRSGAQYTKDMKNGSNPFADWNISQRYGHRTDITLNRVEAHKSAAEIAKAVLDAAILDGVVQ